MAPEQVPFPAVELTPANYQPLISTDGGPRLRGGECQRCQRRFFPMRPQCPYCAAQVPRIVALPSRGTLYSYAVVFVSSSRPVPYTLGYVDLEGNVRVLASIDGSDGLQPDMPVTLAVSDVGDWSFKP